MIVSNQRIVFIGAKTTREWLLSKLLSTTPTKMAKGKVVYIALAVSNRQKVSGVAVPASQFDELEYRIEVALAHLNGTREELAAEVQAELDRLPTP